MTNPPTDPTTPVAKPCVEGEALLFALLSPAEVELLSAYLFDQRPQHDIATARGRKQTTVSAELRRLMKRLEDAGIPVPRPPRRRDATRGTRPRSVDPVKLDRLTNARDDDGVTRGRWINAHPVERAKHRYHGKHGPD